MMRKLLFSLFTVGMSSLIANAQEDISEFLDDKGMSEYENVIKVGVDPLNGEYTISYEHVLGVLHSVQVSLGVVNMQRQHNLYDSQWINPIPESGLAFVGSVSLRQYFSFGAPPHGFYVALEPKFHLMDERWFLNILFINPGYQFSLSDNLKLDLNVGLGFRFYSTEGITVSLPYFITNEYETTYAFNTSAKIGYYF